MAAGRRRGVWRACDGGWSAGVGGRSAGSGKGNGDGMAGCRERRHGVCSLEKENYTLVLQFMIVSIASLIGLQFSMFCNCTPGRISKLAFDFERLFYFGPLPLIHAIWPLIDN